MCCANPVDVLKCYLERVVAGLSFAKGSPNQLLLCAVIVVIVWCSVKLLSGSCVNVVLIEEDCGFIYDSRSRDPMSESWIGRTILRWFPDSSLLVLVMVQRSGCVC